MVTVSAARMAGGGSTLGDGKQAEGGEHVPSDAHPLGRSFAAFASARAAAIRFSAEAYTLVFARSVPSCSRSSRALSRESGAGCSGGDMTTDRRSTSISSLDSTIRSVASQSEHTFGHLRRTLS
jgi:hypothetical protein